MLRFDKSAYFLLALVLLTLPLSWLLGWGIATALHEFCHIAAIRLVGGRILGIRVGLWGMRITISPMPPGRELLCALAGPLGSLLLVCFFRCFPSMAVCAGVQAAFNLLPVYPLDGGRALRCLLARLGSRGERLCLWVENAAISMILAGGCFLGLGRCSAIAVMILIIQKISLQSAATQGTIVLHEHITQKK